MSQTPVPPDSTSAAVPPTPPKKRRRWLWILLILLIGLLLIVALLPTIISTSPVRAIVVSQVNKQLNGSVEIDDWSIGWTSGVRVSGIKVFDDQKAQILQLKEFSTGLSLLGAARGNIDLGKTTIDGLDFNAKIDETGQSNFQKLLKTEPSAKSAPAAAPTQEPAKAPAATPAAAPASASPAGPKLPNVKGDIVLTNITGKIERTGTPAAFSISRMSGEVNIADINSPISETLQIQFEKLTNGVGGQPAGSVLVKGTAAAIKSNVLDLNSADAKQTVQLLGIDLASLAPLLPASVGISKITGQTDGQFALVVADGKSATLSGDLTGQNISATGDKLKGDTYSSKALKVHVPPVVVAMPNGPMDATAFAVKTGSGAVEPIAITWDQGSVMASADASLAALQNLAANKPAGGNGSIDADVKIDLGAIAKQLPHALPLKQGTTITSANFAQTVKLAIAPAGATFNLQTDINNVAGQNNGQAISMQPVQVAINGKINASTAATQPSNLPDVRDVSLKLTSGFATADFSAPTLSQLNGKAHAELADVQKQLGQFVDFGNKTATGALDVVITSKGDVNDLTKPINVNATATVTNLNVTGLADQPVNEPRIVGTVVADLDTANGTGLSAAKNVKLTAQVGSEQQPTVDVLATADATLTPNLATTFNLQKADIDLPQLQKELGPLVPALRNAKPLDLGKLTAQIAGKLNQTGDNTTASLSQLNVAESKGLFSLAEDQGGVTVAMGKTGPPSASGKIHMKADLVRASQIAQSLQASSTTAPASTHALAGGTLDGTIGLSSDATAINVSADFNANDVSMPTSEGATKPQMIAFGVKASPLADFSSIKALSTYVKASFADITLNGDSIDLPKPPVGSKGVALPVVHNLKLNVSVPDVGPLNTLAQAFLPPDDPKNPRLSVPVGTIKVAGVVDHQGTATVLTISDLSITDCRLQNGPNVITVKPIQMQLAAKVDTTGDASQPLADQIKQVAVTQLVGHLGYAELTMPQPITIDQPLGAMHASAQVGLSGEIADLTTFIEKLNGKKAGELYPFSGKYAFVETVSTTGNTITLKGSNEVDNLTVSQNGKPVVNEPKVSIANDVSLDLTAHNATINALTVDMPSSGAVKVAVTGGVTDWETKRQINAIDVKLHYTLEKLWPIVKPLLSPSTQDQLKDLQTAGTFDREIHVGGSYPAGVDSATAIKSLTADGSLALQKLSTMGIEVTDADLPFMLSDGIVRTVYANKGGNGANLAPAIKVNNGTVQISNLTIDLTQPDPRLTTPPNYELAKGIALNGVLAAQLGKFLPLFNSADQASGLLNVTIVACNRLPLSGLVMKSDAANDGTANITYTIEKVQITSSLTSALAVAGVNSQSLQGDIKDGSISIANGQAKQAMTLTLGEQDKPIQFGGGVNLTNETFNNYSVNLPTSLLKQIDKNLVKYLPAGASVAVSGPLASPHLDLQNTVKNMVGDATKKAAIDALTGKKSGDSASSQPSSPEDTLGGLINAFGKKKKKNNN